MQIQQLVDDILLRVKEGTSDDSYLEKSQVSQWIVTYRDALVKEYLDGLISKGKPVDSYYFETEECLEVQESDSECDGCDKFFVEISKQPMSLLDDAGVIKVITSDGVIVYRKRLEAVEWMNDLPYTKSSKNNLTFYRDNKKMVLEGIKSIPTNTAFAVTYIPTASSQTLTITDDLKIHDSLIPLLLEAIEEVAKREVYQLGDLSNNAVDDKEVSVETRP